MPGGFHADVGIVAPHLHAQLPGGVGQRAAYSAQADDTQPLVGDLMAGEFALALFHLLGDVGIILVFLHPVDACHHIPAAQEHAAQGQLHDAEGVGAGGVEHHHAGFRAFLQRDIIDARAGSGDGHQIFGKLHVMHGGAAHQDGLGIGYGFGFLIVLRPEGLALGGDGIEVMDLIHIAHLFSFSNAAMKSTRAVTPSIGMAL